jgi:hypothetical protein
LFIYPKCRFVLDWKSHRLLKLRSLRGPRARMSQRRHGSPPTHLFSRCFQASSCLTWLVYWNWGMKLTDARSGGSQRRSGNRWMDKGKRWYIPSLTSTLCFLGSNEKGGVRTAGGGYFGLAFLSLGSTPAPYRWTSLLLKTRIGKLHRVRLAPNSRSEARTAYTV